MPETNPVLVEVLRGAAVENRHRGAVAIVNSAGELLDSWGDVETPVYPRSAIKLLQAIPLLESGAADRYKLSAEELALACSSHSATPHHMRVAEGWLRRLGLSETALSCGPHAPLDATSAAALVREGRKPGRLHNNCSGKHLAMLTTALFREEPADSYAAPEHPVQLRIRKILAELSGEPFEDLPVGVDGCGVPTIAMPLRALAKAFANAMDGSRLATARASAIRRLTVAVSLHPELAGGPGQLSTEMLRRRGRELYVKGGSDGVYCAALPEYRIGVALKIDDGSKRAADAALIAILEGLEMFDENDLRALHAVAPATLRNHAGTTIGEIRPARDWLE